MISTGPPGSWVVGVGLGFYASVEVAEFQGRLQLASRAPPNINPETRNAKNPPLNRPSKYKPPGACT